MLTWLENAIFYEIYPTSFFDSDGDGVGDLRGITEKVEYLKNLGITAVWLNPIYKSPSQDGGYDVEDYYAVDPKFGDMQDLDKLIKVFHDNGIKVVLDLVIGHTSVKHKWFTESAKRQRNEYSDYYIWTNSVFDDYPNMIIGLFERDGGYMKNYYASQAALNYGFNKTDEKHGWMMRYDDERLRPLREAVLNIMRFYLDKGVDGFRVDMASSLVKNGEKFNADKPFDDSDKGLEGIRWLWNKMLGTLRREYRDKVYIAEWVEPQKSIGKCGFDMDFLTHDTLAFNELYRCEPNTNLDSRYEQGRNYFSREGKGSLKKFVRYVEYLYGRMGDKGCFTAATGTHDEVRMPTNKSDDLIKTIFAFLLTLKHIPLIYYGDEIGIGHSFGISKDGGGVRTGARTPMQWNDEKNKGFSLSDEIYLPIYDKAGVDVKTQEGKGNSLLNTVKELIKIRKSNNCFSVSGKQKFYKKGYPCIFTRSDETSCATVIINPSDRPYRISKARIKGKILLSNNVTQTDKKFIFNGASFLIAKDEMSVF